MTQSDIEKILWQLLKDQGIDGWSSNALTDGFPSIPWYQLNQQFPSPEHCWRFLIHRLEDSVLAPLEESSFKDKILELGMRLFDYLTPHKGVVHRLGNILCHPKYLSILHSHGYKGLQPITSNPLIIYGVFGAWISCLPAWLGDSTIDQAVTFAKWDERLTLVLEWLPS